MRLNRRVTLYSAHLAGSVPSDKGYATTSRRWMISGCPQSAADDQPSLPPGRDQNGRMARLTATCWRICHRTWRSWLRPNRIIAFLNTGIGQHPDSTALLVLVLQGAVVRQQLTVFDQPVSQAELSQVSNKLNVFFTGLNNPRFMQRKRNSPNWKKVFPIVF